MPDTNTPFSLRDCAKKFNRSEKEIQETLLNLGLYQRITKGMPIDEDKILKLREHFRRQQKTPAGADAGSRSTRKIRSTEVTERKNRARLQRPRLSLAELRRQKLGEPPAEPAAASQPQEAATIATKSTKPAAKTAQPAAKKATTTASQPAAKATSTAAAKPAAKKTATTAAKPAAKKAATAAAKKTAKKTTAETTTKPAAAAAKKAATAPVQAAESTATETTETIDAGDARKSAYNIEQLLNKQQAHKEQRNVKEKQLQEAKLKKAETDDSEKTKGKTDTIKMDKAAVAKHQKKRKKNISRSEAREITSENQHTFKKPTAPVVREVKISDAISVAKLATETALKSSVIIRKLMGHGMTVTANEVLDKETAWIIVEELGHKPVEAPEDDIEKELLKRDVVGEDIKPRAPVVTVMGHVDHGKTSLLDHIRKTRVVSGEAGGITQHIGAYRVETKIGAITFLDTPGHALFSQMRARGAKITDIVLLVVAADDGVKPQTIEAINHAKAAQVPIIVAFNKMDKPEADIERVKRELSNHGVLPEDWGGDTMMVPVSAQTGQGIDNLLEALAMQTELLELSAPLDVPAAGVIIEARLDKGRGIVATLVVTHGILKRGDSFLCGTESGRVRMMWNLSSPKLDAALPSIPVEIQGLSSIPEAGTELFAVEDERTAREVAATRQSKSRLSKMTSRRLPTNNIEQAALLDAASTEQEWKELKVVIKADVEGSREALAAALTAIAGKNAGVKVIHSAVGAVTESDIYLAQTGNGLVIAFNVRPDSRARKLAEMRGVKIITGNVVYELVEKAHDSVLGLLAPIIEETVIGSAAVQKVFSVSKVGNIAGCRVEEGLIRAKAPLRLVRDGVMVHEGAMASLYHFKDEVSEVRAGSECGIGINNYNDIKAGDVIEVLERTETAPEM